MGRVKRLERITENTGTKSGKYHYKEKILTARKNVKRNGYYEISLHKDQKEKRFKIHRLVAEAYIPNIENKSEVNHIDGNKENNCVSNLEWVTSKENKKHAWDNGLVNADHKKKAIVCNETGEIFESVIEASRQLNCDRSGIFDVLKGRKSKVKKMSFSYYRSIDER